MWRLSSLGTDEFATVYYSGPGPGFGVRLPPSFLEPFGDLLATESVSSFCSDSGAPQAAIQDAVLLPSRCLGNRFVSSRRLGKHEFRAQEDIYHGL